MSWWGALIDGLFGLGQNVYNNEFNAQEAQKNRAFQSAEAEKNRNFQAQQAEIAFDRQQEYFDKNLSFQAQVSQMRQAGLNPAMMYGGSTTGGGTPPASASPAGSAPSGSSASASPVGLISFFEKMLDLEGKEIDNQAKEQNLDLNKRKTEMEIALLKAQESREYMTIKNMQSDIEVNENRIKVGNSEFEVNMSLRDLNHAKTVLETMNAAQVEALTPVMVEYYTAETEEAKQSALLRIAQAGGVEVENREREANIGRINAETSLVQSQTSKTQTDEKLGTADTIITGVETAVSIGEVLLEGAAEIFGFSETLSKYKSTTTHYDKKGNVKGRTVVESSGNKNQNSNSRVTKNRRRR